MSRHERAAADPFSVAILGHRTGEWLPWLLFGITFILTLLGLVFLALSWSAPVPDTFAFRGHAALLALAFGSVGLFLARIRPQNSIGWLFLVAGIAGGIQEFGQEYAAWGFFVRMNSLPAMPLLAWVASWIFSIALASIFLASLLFPNGRLPSKRWRPFAWLVVILWACTVFVAMIKPGPLRFAPYLDNPFSGSELVWASVSTIANAGLALGLVVTGVSVIVRLRRASVIERQQLKWFTYAAALICAVGGIYTTAYRTLAVVVPGLVKPVDILAVVIPTAMPFAVAFAILRYHLYDIDLLIRRTLIYGTLTSALAVVYFSSVLLLEQVLNLLTGQGQTDVVIVLSTLAIAALFAPLRRRIQQVIDRRFYRRKYDAQKVLAAFGQTVRDEVDLDRLTQELESVVGETMQPASVSLWLKGTEDDLGKTKKGS